MVDRGRLNFCKDLSFVDPRIRSHAPSDKVLLLDADYEPALWDVICQGGKDSYDHIGNRRFRVCIDNNLETYTKAKTKHEKSMVVTVIVDAVRESSTQERGGFVRKDLVSGRWYEVGDKIAREKVGHALRDAIKLRQKLEKKHATAASSSSASKTERSRPEKQQSRPAKRRRTEVSSLCKEKKAKTESTPLPVPSGGQLPSLPRAENEWEKSLSASAEQFAAADCDSEPFGEEGDDESRSGDSVLNEMALETSSTSGADDVEKAYQSSLDQLQMVEEEEDDSFSLDGSFPNAETAAAKKSPVEPPNPAFASKPEGAFDDFMKRFLGTATSTPLGSSNSKPMTATSKFEWKPPGDSPTDAAFEIFMKGLNPNPTPSTPSLKGVPQFSPPAMVNNQNMQSIANAAITPLGGLSSKTGPNNMPVSTPNTIIGDKSSLPTASLDFMSALEMENRFSSGLTQLSHSNLVKPSSGQQQQGPAVIDDLF